MVLNHGVALPISDKASIIKFIWAVLDPDSVRDLAQPDALGVRAVLIVAFGLTKIPPKITTPYLVIPNQTLDPLMTDTNAGLRRHEATDSLWRPSSLPIWRWLMPNSHWAWLWHESFEISCLHAHHEFYST